MDTTKLMDVISKVSSELSRVDLAEFDANQREELGTFLALQEVWGPTVKNLEEKARRMHGIVMEDFTEPEGSSALKDLQSAAEQLPKELVDHLRATGYVRSGATANIAGALLHKSELLLATYQPPSSEGGISEEWTQGAMEWTREAAETVQAAYDAEMVDYEDGEDSV
eukprot:CAMPEP_0185747132 /NCGR_PEP_ID=MMETSP1174-20130828/5783_1 /TAXON_ID=35687 /ORGANISM="Dictyocha speculum, Strain CCMP1381" /LENGTH=167 /DNA_ID=CAMNT_0028422183 /DNA_START=221 /DNA_END=724 /DNA_ORIENTATION=+